MNAGWAHIMPPYSDAAMQHLYDGIRYDVIEISDAGYNEPNASLSIEQATKFTERVVQKSKEIQVSTIKYVVNRFFVSGTRMDPGAFAMICATISTITTIQKIIIDNVAIDPSEISAITAMMRALPLLREVKLHRMEYKWINDETTAQFVRALIGTPIRKFDHYLSRFGPSTRRALADWILDPRCALEILYIAQPRFIPDDDRTDYSILSALERNTSIRTFLANDAWSLFDAHAAATSVVYNNTHLTEFKITYVKGGLDDHAPANWDPSIEMSFSRSIETQLRLNVARRAVLTTLDSIALIQFIDGDRAFRAAVRAALT